MFVSLEEAQHLLSTGHVVGVPTETVYGLAASLKHPEAIDQIFKLKGRPANNPLIIHAANNQAILPYIQTLSQEFLSLADSFWPGPMTIVTNIVENQIPEIARAGLPTAAFRVPAHPLTQELLHAVGPLVMPSANISGRPSSTKASHVETDFGKAFPVLDGGACQRGVESTILFHSKGCFQIIRQGALTAEDFGCVLGYNPEIVAKNVNSQEAPLCPGQQYRHYAPKARLILSTKPSQETGTLIIGFSDRRYPGFSRCLSFGLSTKPHDAAQNLYSLLRLLDEEDIAEAWIDIDFPKNGLWTTIFERLERASQ